MVMLTGDAREEMPDVCRCVLDWLVIEIFSDWELKLGCVVCGGAQVECSAFCVVEGNVGVHW